MNAPDRLTELAGAVADGAPVDWIIEQSSLDVNDLDSLAQLQILAEIARVHREGSAAPAGSGTDARHGAGVASAGSARKSSAADTTPLFLWGSLRVLEQLGAGTFGEVFRAWDSSLDREVALKLLRPRATGTPASTDSIVREGQMLARVRHANVMAVYGAQEIDGRIGIWGELLRGRTLADIVRQDGPLSGQEAVVFGDAVCRALTAVHRAGLLHRDIKAQNVMRESGGRVVLMDLGLGRDAGVSPVTGPELAGTPLYLAPELFQGGAASIQSDIYSVGVLLFYLVTGEFPVAGRNLAELEAAHEQGRRTLLQDLRPDLPPTFCQAVEGALRKPASRYQTVGALQQALTGSLGVPDFLVARDGDASASDSRRDARALLGESKSASDPQDARPPARSRRSRRALTVAASVVVLAVLASVGLWIAGTRQGAPDPRSVAVLPFKNLSGDEGKDYFADALTQEIIARLWKVGPLHVIAPTSVMQYRDTRKGLKQIGGELGVGTVIDGSVRWAGDRVRVITSLVDVTSGKPLWSETYDRRIEDILDVESDISQRVAEALNGVLSPSQTAMLRANARVDFETYQLYLKGRYQLSLRTETSVDAAADYFRQAVERDRSYAPAYAGLANAYNVKWGMGFSPTSLSTAREEGLAAATRALELDESLAEAHTALGFIGWTNLDWDTAGRSYRRSLELNPNDAATQHWFALYLTCVGQFDEAIEHIQMARRLDPINLRINSALGWVLYQARQFGRAEQHLRANLEIDPTLAAARSTLAIVLSAEGKHAAAIAEMKRAVEVSHDNPESEATLAYIYGRAAQPAEARAWLARLDASSEPPRVMAGSLAAIYASLGDVDRAFEWLERAFAARDIWVAHLKVEPRLDPLRGDPRFRRLLERAHLLESPPSARAHAQAAGEPGRSVRLR